MTSQPKVIFLGRREAYRAYVVENALNPAEVWHIQRLDQVRGLRVPADAEVVTTPPGERWWGEALHLIELYRVVQLS